MLDEQYRHDYLPMHKTLVSYVCYCSEALYRFEPAKLLNLPQLVSSMSTQSKAQIIPVIISESPPFEQ